MKHRGRLFAISTATLALAVLLTAAILGRRWIVEEYLIRRLSSNEEETRMAAADALGKMKSVRAIPYLLPLLAHQDRDATSTEWVVMPGKPNDPKLLVLTRLAHNIYLIGKDALPYLGEAEQKSKLPRQISAIIEAINCNPATVKVVPDSGDGNDTFGTLIPNPDYLEPGQTVTTTLGDRGQRVIPPQPSPVQEDRP